MIENLNQLRVTMQQMERVIRALDDLKKDVRKTSCPKTLSCSPYCLKRRWTT
ncbi:MAG: hypothetical protein ACE5KM_19025 [Planctomycetaceae bacterium]